MKVLTPGHEYELASMEHQFGQTIAFIQKEVKDNEFVTVKDGTTNEEVLLMLIDRLKFLGNKLPNRQTALAITKCEEALMWLMHRTLERQQRGVEGTNKP